MYGKKRRNSVPRSSGPSGRTVGCLTCRRRRVKCDRVAPVCGACRRLRLECLSRPAAERFLWLPVNQVGIDSEPSEPLGDRTSDQDSAQTERTTQARRTALATDKERNIMCQQLLQSTAHIDFDDILNSLRTSAEAGVGAVSSGPFTVFPTQAVQTMDIAPIPRPSSPIISAPSQSSSNSGSHSSSPFSAPLDLLPSELMHQSDENTSVDILSSVPEPGWEESTISGAGFGDFPLDFTHELSYCAFNALELQSDAHTPELLSPLPFHLPFLQPSQILERIPKDAFSLIEYYGSRMLFFHSPFPSHKPPWKIMHHPSVLETTAALLVAAPVKHAQLALLYAILAISSFHIDWCTVSNQKSQSQSQLRNNFGQTDNIRSYWWNIGEKFERDAKLQLQLALKREFTGPAKAKYKHILMALLCMVTICVSTGRMGDARCFLLDAERVIRLRGLPKPQPSKKVRLLHNIFLYNRIIEESTFCYPGMGRSESSSAIEPSTQPFLPADDVVDPKLLSRSREDGGNGSVHDRSVAGAELSLSERLIANDGAWFETIYGIPMTLMHLLSQTTSLVHEAENQHSFSQSADLHFMASFTHRARTLEDLVCGFRWEPIQVGHSGGHILADPSAQLQTASLAGHTSAHSNVMRHLVSAMHQGLLIFFYRRIRNLNSYALQPFVKRTISDLCAFQSAKDKNDIVTPVICWPGFIAGAEALEEEDRQQFRQWFKQSGRGWRNFDTIGEIVENLWKAREQSGSRAGEVTWEHFSREYRTAIIAT